MFADSNTRMYFDYYSSKNSDDAVLKILKLFVEEVLAPLQRGGDDFIFLRSDNGQFDSNGVRAYCRAQGVFNEYTHPYHLQ
jgi:hypothetical protein